MITVVMNGLAYLHNAYRYEVIDGHLHLYKREEEKSYASYAPGVWQVVCDGPYFLDKYNCESIDAPVREQR
jgi:hypothetical protein